LSHHRSVWAVSVALLLTIAFVPVLPVLVAGAPAAPPNGHTAHNVILMIADGAGFNHVEASRMYQFGNAGAQVYTQFPHQYAVSTYPYDTAGYDAGYWSRLDFGYPKLNPTDSAAAGTALATGVKTRIGMIGMAPDWVSELENTVERAELNGKATGVVTSVYLADATPAAFVAHSTSRKNYDSIAQQMLLSSALDLLMGGGHPWFDRDGVALATPNYDLVGGASTWQALEAGSAGADADGDGVADPWTLVQTLAQFRALTTGDTPARVCGIPQVARTLQHDRPGDANAIPFAVPFIQSTPTLQEMALGALNVLDEDPDGFFLMIEGGAVDWASHDNHAGRMIEEMIDFDLTVAAVVAWVEAHSNWHETLLVVTADHETGYLWGPGSDPDWLPLEDRGAAQVPGLTWNHWDHTNSLVPLFARGDAGDALGALADEYDPRRGFYLDNAELGALLLQCVEAPPAPVCTLSVPLVISQAAPMPPSGD